jgi:hypothetical protein
MSSQQSLSPTIDSHFFLNDTDFKKPDHTPTMSTMIPTLTVFDEASSTVSSSSSTATCTTAVPDKYGYVPPDSCNANYGFYPQWEDNTAFAVVFGLSTVAHLAQAVILKKVTHAEPMTGVMLLG